MISNNILLILLSISLFVLVGILVIKEEFVVNATLENHTFENIEKTGPANISPEVFQKSTEPEVIELNFSGEVLTCTNKIDVEYVIDIRLRNFDVKNKSITIYPLNLTFNLLPKQIKRADIIIPNGISTLKLASGGEELKVRVPPCVNGNEGSNTGFNTQTTIKEVDEIPEFPSIGLPIISIMVLLFIVKKKK